MGKVTACHTCKYNGAGDPICITCRRVSQDDIRISKSAHTKAELVASSIPSGDNSTDYSGKVGDVLRLIYAVSDMTPLEFVAALHIARGKKVYELADELAKLITKCRESKTLKRTNRGHRSLVAMKKEIMKNRVEIINRFWRSMKGSMVC